MAMTSNPSSARPADATGLGLVVLLFVVFIGLAGFGAVLPLLPFYGQAFSAPAWQVTLLFSSYSLGQFIGELTWGRLSDRVGRRPVLLGTMLCSAAAFMAFAFAPTIWLAILARGVSGFFCGNMSTVQGYVADVSPPEKLARRLALVSAVSSLGFVIGPAMGGLLAHPEAGQAGFRVPILVASGMYMAAGLGVLLFLRESRRPGASAARGVGLRTALKGAVADPVLLRLLIMTFVSFSAFSAVMPTIGLWAEATFGWSPREVGALMGASAAAGAGGQILLTNLAGRRVSELTMIAASLLLAALFLSGLALSGSPTAAAVCFIGAVLGHMASQPAAAALISHLTPPDRQGAVLGANMAAGALARVTGPITAGVLISSIGLSAPFVAGALGMLPAIWLASDAARRRRLSAKTPILQ